MVDHVQYHEPLSRRTPSPLIAADMIRDDRGYGAHPARPLHAPSAPANPVLGVFGLSIRTQERDLDDEFRKYGEVEKVVIVYDQRVSLVP